MILTSKIGNTSPLLPHPHNIHIYTRTTTKEYPMKHHVFNQYLTSIIAGIGILASAYGYWYYTHKEAVYHEPIPIINWTYTPAQGNNPAQAYAHGILHFSRVTLPVSIQDYQQHHKDKFTLACVAYRHTVKYDIPKSLTVGPCPNTHPTSINKPTNNTPTTSKQ